MVLLINLFYVDLVKPGNRNCFKRKDSLERDCKACGKISMIDQNINYIHLLLKIHPIIKG